MKTADDFFNNTVYELCKAYAQMPENTNKYDYLHNAAETLLEQRGHIKRLTAWQARAVEVLKYYQDEDHVSCDSDGDWHFDVTIDHHNDLRGLLAEAEGVG